MGVELQNRGHQVYIGADKDKEQFITVHNVHYLCLDGSIEASFKRDYRSPTRTSSMRSNSARNSLEIGVSNSNITPPPPPVYYHSSSGYSSNSDIESYENSHPHRRHTSYSPSPAMTDEEEEIDHDQQRAHSERLHKEKVNKAAVLNKRDYQTILEMMSRTWIQAIDYILNTYHFDLCILPAMSVLFAYSSLEKLRSIPFIVSYLYPMTPTKYFAPPSYSGDSDSWFQVLNTFKVYFYSLYLLT